MQFCLGVIPQTATGCHSNPIEFLYALFCHKCINFSPTITLITKWFMLCPSSGLKNEQHHPKCCDSLQLLVSHLVLQLMPCFNLLYKNNGHCQSHSFVSVY